MRSTLSRFSKIALPLTLALPAGWLALDRPDAAAAVARERAAPSATVLELGGTPVGTLRSAAGGSAVATVVPDVVGAGAPPKKHVGAVGYEDLELELDLTLERAVYDWIGAAWAGNAQRKSGALVGLDMNGNARNARQFHNALITEVTFPACDASSKEAGFITLLLAPERVTSAAAPAGKATAVGVKGKSWLASNFKLEIDGLDTSRVIRIDPIVFKQPVAAGDVGRLREPTQRASAAQFENLRITLSEAGADSWRSWHEDFVIKGNSSDKNERAGRLLLLAPNVKDELARVEFSNLGIIALRPRVSAAGVGQLEAELYVERLAFAVGRK
jgi:hypothetical protein